MTRINKTILREASLFYTKVKFENKLDVVTKDLQELLDGIQNKGVFCQLLHLEQITLEEKVKIMADILVDMSEDTKDYLAPYLNEEMIFHLVEAIEAFLNIYESNKLEIVTAVPLTDEQIETIAMAFQKKTNKEYDAWLNIIDDNIIAGVLVKSKEYLYDGTVMNKLNQFKNSLHHTDLKG